MRGYMARPCDKYFTLDHKLNNFVKMSLRAYRVPEDEIKSILATIQKIDMIQVAEKVMDELFATLSMRFDFHLSEN